MSLWQGSAPLLLDGVLLTYCYVCPIKGISLNRPPRRRPRPSAPSVDGFRASLFLRPRLALVMTVWIIPAWPAEDRSHGTTGLPRTADPSAEREQQRRRPPPQPDQKYPAEADQLRSRRPRAFATSRSRRREAGPASTVQQWFVMTQILLLAGSCSMSDYL